MSTLYNSMMEKKLTPDNIENNLNMKDINNHFDIVCNDLSSIISECKIVAKLSKINNNYKILSGQIVVEILTYT